MTRALPILLALLGCHHGPDAAADGAVGSDAPSCDQACVTQGWWIGVSSNCTVLCSANATLTECMQSDCEVVEASRYTTARESLAPMLFSAQAHSFYLFGQLASKPFTFPSACKLQIGTASPESYSCQNGSLVLPTATLQAATQAQATALDAAAAANTAGRYSY